MKHIKKFQKILGALGVSISLLGTAYAQTLPTPPVAASPSSPMIYPAQGQSQAQMDKDKAECSAWATQQTGYDPLAAASALQAQQPVPLNQPAPPTSSGGVVRGGAKGAAAGAAVGAIAGDAGKGAAIGAASGGTVGGVRQRRQGAAQQQAMTQQQTAQQQQLAQQQAGNQQKLDAYKRAFEACMEGKGYTVKW